MFGMAILAICRICRDVSPISQLHSPCKCSGSIRYVHGECLEIWLKHSSKSTCELCGHEFKFQAVYRPDMPERLPTLIMLKWFFKKSMLILKQVLKKTTLFARLLVPYLFRLLDCQLTGFECGLFFQTLIEGYLLCFFSFCISFLGIFVLQNVSHLDFNYQSLDFFSILSCIVFTNWFPYILGKFLIRSDERFLCMGVGYLLFLCFGFLYAFKNVASVSRILKSLVLIVKIMMFFCIEIVLTNLYLGWLVCFFAGFKTRNLFFMFLMGQLSGVCFTNLINCLRRVFRSGALCFISNPNDQSVPILRTYLSTPIKQHLKTITIKIFALFLAVTCTVGLFRVLCTVLNITRRQSSTLFLVPFDLALPFVTFRLFYRINLTPKFTKLMLFFFRIVASLLSLSSFLFYDGHFSERSGLKKRLSTLNFSKARAPIVLNPNHFLLKSKQVYMVPALDNVQASSLIIQIPSSPLNPSEWTICYLPKFFKLRFMIASILCANFITLLTFLIYVVPLSLGRLMFLMDDAYNFCIGVILISIPFYFVACVMNFQLFLKWCYFYFFCGVFVPCCLSQLSYLYLSPFFNYQQSFLHEFGFWFLILIIFLHFDSNVSNVVCSIASRSWSQISLQPMWEIQTYTLKFLFLSFVPPFLLSFFFNFAYPFYFCGVFLIFAGLKIKDVVNVCQNKIRDDEYLINRDLSNYQHGSK